ncbi:hypothetical protein BGP_0662 [Beggiatoa sp. PS]|nr:hypothetical protein BGP_0662 [Beggiatoa sp. PS]
MKIDAMLNFFKLLILFERILVDTFSLNPSNNKINQLSIKVDLSYFQNEMVSS